jgi:hypothetical protein
MKRFVGVMIVMVGLAPWSARAQGQSLGFPADVDVAFAVSFLDEEIVDRWVHRPGIKWISRDQYVRDKNTKLDEMTVLNTARSQGATAYVNLWLYRDARSFDDGTAAAIGTLLNSGLVDLNDVYDAYQSGANIYGNAANSNYRCWIALWLLYDAWAYAPLPQPPSTPTAGFRADVDVAIAMMLLDVDLPDGYKKWFDVDGAPFAGLWRYWDVLDTLVVVRGYPAGTYLGLWFYGDTANFHENVALSIDALLKGRTEICDLDLDAVNDAYTSGAGIYGSSGRSSPRAWIALWLLYYAWAYDPLP